MRLLLRRRMETDVRVLLIPAFALSFLSACVESTPPVQVPSWAAKAFGADAVQWSTDDGAGAGIMRPELDGARLYFDRRAIFSGTTLASPAQLIALDRQTGSVLWNYPFTGASNVAIAGGAVGAAWGSLEIVQAATGGLLHRFLSPGTSLSSNVASDGTRFYVVTFNGHALAVSPTSDVADWDANISGSTTTTGFGVTVDNDIVALTLRDFAFTSGGGDSGIVAVVERMTGAMRWRVPVPTSLTNSGVVKPPVVSSGKVIVVTQGHHVLAYDRQTGALGWEFDASEGQPTFASDGIAECNGTIVVPTGKLGLVALDAATGDLRWKLGNIEQGSLFDVYCSHGTVMAGGLRLFDAATGASLATYPLDRLVLDSDFWISSVVRDAEWLYVGTNLGFAKIRAP